MYVCTYILYNRNIWRNKTLANRLNSPFGENLKWQQGYLLEHVIFNMDTNEADSCVKGFRYLDSVCGRITDMQTGKRNPNDP